MYDLVGVYQVYHPLSAAEGVIGDAPVKTWASWEPV